MKAFFQVEVDGKRREAEISFGNEHDIQTLARWRFSGSDDNEAVVDALEYARLASKRWRYYRRAGATASSTEELHGCTRRNPKTEVAMIFIAHAKWPSPTPILGFAYFRRTWCHHFVVDFLSAHPRVVEGRPEHIRGVGRGILDQLVTVAEELGVPCVWGEATALSAPFYEHVLNVEGIRDHFFIEDEVMAYYRHQLRKSRQQMLAPGKAK